MTAVTVTTLLAGGAGLAVATNDRPATTSEARLPEVCHIQGRGTTKIATAKLYIEYNAADDDIGVHGAFDDSGWSKLCVLDPSGRPILAVDPRGQLNDLTMGGIFFESREPPASEFSMADLARAFPAGQYAVRGASYDGTVLTGTALFTHAVPAPPEITSPRIAEDPEQLGPPVSRTGLRVSWDRVTETVAGEPIRITGYEVIVTPEVPDDPHGFSRPAYDVHVPPGVTSLTVPPEFLQAGTVYELEVLALERSGNQTISVGFVKTR
jgi:hypothetical protein